MGVVRTDRVQALSVTKTQRRAQAVDNHLRDAGFRKTGRGSAGAFHVDAYQHPRGCSVVTVREGAYDSPRSFRAYVELEGDAGAVVASLAGLVATRGSG